MRNIIQQLLALGPELTAYILTAPLITRANAQFTQQAVPSPNLDLGSLGRVAVGGDFDSISLYTYEGQNENTSTNGSQSLLTRYPDGAFQSLALADADASIAAMCSFVSSDGTFQGVVVGGNFTSLGGVRANSIALWNPENNEITALDGLTGPVNTLYCDSESGTVYVGGFFMGGNSTNAMAWTTGWVNLPFAGFNGPVNTITKNHNNMIVFGGQFDGLGNASAPATPDEQVINLGGGVITAEGSTSTDGFSDPRNIVCKTGQTEGSGNTWLLSDDRGGFWEASLGFGFNPTMLRLYNSDYEGRGTKSFYFEEMNSGGILNLTYTDPTTGQTASCTRFCPLPEGNTTAQDFHFVRSVGMSVFRVWITDYYGAGAGLNGIELYSDEIFSYAVNDFNEPACDGVTARSSSSANPADRWTRVANNGQSAADFLSASLTEASQVDDSTNVVFTPNLQQSGNYSVTVFTPGCIVDNSCASRGQVTMTGSVTSDEAPVTTTLFQTNNYDKFDQIYYGYIDAEGFQPTVTLSPIAGQNVPLTVVASRIRFELITSTGGLNGLYEYNPNEVNVDNDFTDSAINNVGSSLEPNAIVRHLVEHDETLFVAGRLGGEGISNIFSIGNDNATTLPRGGLNGDVLGLQLNGSTLYLGGTFNNTATEATEGLNNLAIFDIGSNEWRAIGAGVNGAVFNIIPLRMNITTDNAQDTFAISGDFTQVNGFGSNAEFQANGFAVWVPSESNWLRNIDGSNSALNGQLTTYTEVPNMGPVFGGMITSQGLDYGSVVQLEGQGDITLRSLGIDIQSIEDTPTGDPTSMRKRAIQEGATATDYTGVYDGLYYKENDLNITVLGGSFASRATNGSIIENLMFINNTESTRVVSGVSGLNRDSTFVAMDTYGTQLWAGGVVNGTVNGGSLATGLVVYDLSLNRFAAPHPPALGGANVTVHAIAAQPEGSDVYVGGDYDTAGSLPCGPLCYYDTEARQWQGTGTGLSGVVHAMLWSSNSDLLIAGNISINGNRTTMATYNTNRQEFTPFEGASELPGPITAISSVDSRFTQLWVSGIATQNQTVFLSKFADGRWTSASGLGDSTTVRKLQIMPLTSNHADSALVEPGQSLMILGNINIPDQGNASAVLFNGTDYQPYILTNMQDGSQGSLSAIFVENPQNFMRNDSRGLALGIIVVIGLAIALVLTGIIICAGFLLERRRRRIEGYVPITGDKSANVNRLPPEQLFSKLEGKSSPPKL